MRGEPDLDALRALAERAARAAGDVLLRHAGTVLAVQTKSSATDPVSAADRESEQVLVGLLSGARPQDGLLGEEGADASGSSGLRWVLDPLDGTVNYLYGHVGWSVSVACEAFSDGEWSALVGVVYDPLHDELFGAIRGGGAWLGQRRLHVNDPVALDRALVATGFAYDAAHRVLQGAIAARVIAAARDVRRVGSAALDLCSVACGRVDAYYEDTPARWDWAAGALIAREAGAVVTPLPGPNAEPGVLAAGPALHPHLAALVTRPAPQAP